MNSYNKAKFLLGLPSKTNNITNNIAVTKKAVSEKKISTNISDTFMILQPWQLQLSFVRITKSFRKLELDMKVKNQPTSSQIQNLRI